MSIVNAEIDCAEIDCATGSFDESVVSLAPATYVPGIGYRAGTTSIYTAVYLYDQLFSHPHCSTPPDISKLRNSTRVNSTEDTCYCTYPLWVHHRNYNIDRAKSHL